MRTSQRFSRSRLVVAACTPVFSALVVEIYLRFFFDRQDPFLRAAIFLPSRWDALAWQLERTHTLLPIVVLMVGVSLLAMALGRWRGRDWSEALQGVGRANLWSLVLLAQQSLVLLVGPLAGGNTWDTLLTSSVLLAFSLAPAGWLAGLWNTACPAQVAFIEPAKPFSARAAQTKLAGAVATYVVVFSTLSILQYQALHVPHGDTGMYEEHLWNFLHGNGFRSQLDDGRLFLGEHFQVSHLLLLPVYVLWPCLPTLNVCQSLALASGAIAIYAIAQERGLTPTIAWTLGLAYLLYDPLHYLNLEASWKTFRPTTLGVPCLFFAFWAFEAHRYRTMLVLLGLSFLAKEEYALVIAGTGILLALRRSRGPLGKREILLGGTICVVGLVLLWLAVSVFIPYCRGAAPHYTTPYFGSLGDSPSAIVRYVLTHPLTVARRLAEPAKLQFLFLLLLPLGFLPLASPSRLLLALPILGYLMLGDLPMLTQLWFQFHAPVVPVVWWAGTVGVSCLRRWLDALHLARLLACLALTTGFWLGRTPLSWRFYDPMTGVVSSHGVRRPRGDYWRDVYLPTDRSRAFPQAFDAIHRNERVAATDYLRSRFTHHRAAHDYPRFRAHVTIDDIDVIVLDKTFGWWGRGPTNADRELLKCMNNPQCRPGTRLTVRGRPFVVAYHDPFYLVVRRYSSSKS